MAISLADLHPAYTADARKVPCPGPLLSVKEAIAQIEIGQILELQATDAGAREDIPAWSKKSGNDYLGVIAHPDYDSHFIERRK